MVPVPRGQHDGIIQKIVDGSQQVFPSLGSISHTVELLSYGREKKIADMSVLKKNAGWSGNPLEHLKTFKSTPIQSGNSGPEKASIN